MQQVITANGKAFSVRWCSVSTIDRALRFAVTGSDIRAITTTFLDSRSTETITHLFDEKKTEYRGYTMFKGVDLNPDGSVVVSLLESTA